ncbi:MAG: FMN-binding protein [Jatrophihabitantaceae bacterium]
MKRVLLSVTGTVLGVVALLGFKTESQLPTAAGGLPSAALPGSTAAATTTSPTSTSTGAPPDPSRTSTSPSAASAPTSVSYTGAAEQTRYGTVQVNITVSAKKITNVSLAQLTAFDRRSQQINSDAAPILLQETLAAQSVQIDAVSGASYTSQGYLQSLQSALDQAGL